METLVTLCINGCFNKAQCKQQNNYHDVDACEKCKVFRDHAEKAKAARTHYQEDQDVDADNTSIFTADMQKVISPQINPRRTLLCQ